MLSKRSFSRGILVALIASLLGTAPSFAQSATTINNALNWLTATQKPNGTWNAVSGGAPELAPRDTARVLIAQSLHNAVATPSANAGYAWLANQIALDSNQFLSEQTLALAAAKRDYTAALTRLAAQRASSADFGAFADNTGDSYDSALALQALVASEPSYQTVIAQVLTQLIVRQNADGGWGIDRGFDSNPVITAEVLIALSLLTQQQPPPAVIAAGQAYLARGIHGDGSIGANLLETSTAFRALALSGYSIGSTSAATLAYMTTRQAADGSWTQDPYLTARVLEAYASNKPNLVIRDTDISASPSPAIDGDTVTMTVRISNIGAAGAAASTLAISVGAASGRQLTTKSIAAIAAGASLTTTATFVATNLSGNQTIAAIANATANVVELRSDDNTAKTSLTVKGKPDLQIYQTDLVTIPAKLQPDQPGTISVTLRNNGEGDATNVAYKITDTVGSVVTTLSQATVDSIAAGGTRVVQLPVALATGSHTITVTLDPALAIPETNENNNTASKSFAVSPVANIDLVVVAGSVIANPPIGTAGQTVTISGTITNTGNTPATANVYFFDGIPGQGGGYFKVLPVGVEPQGSVDVSTNYVVGPNSNVLYIVVDADHKVAEIDESNNSGFAALTDQYVDLSITLDGLVLPKNPLNANQQMTGRAVIRNLGVLPASNVQVQIYDDLPQTGGNKVVDTFVATIAANGKAVIPFSWTLRAGQRFATVLVNPAQTISEINFDNNKVSKFYAANGSEANLALDTSVARTLAIDRSALIIDPINLTLSGRIDVRVAGSAPRAFGVTVFDDIDGDLAFNPEVDTVLGSALGQTGVNPQLVPIPIQGTVRFSPGHPVVYIDSGNSISETNERDNFHDVYQACEGAVTRSPEPFWKWRTNFPSSRIAAVARIVDTNGDDFVDENDVPAVVMTVFGTVVVVRGDTGKMIWSQSPDSSGAQTSPVVADVDNDGKPEIIVHAGNTVSHRMICYNNDGTTKWTSPDLDRDPQWDFVLMFSVNYRYVGMPAVADLEGDGVPELIVGRNVINAQTGAMKWIGTGGSGRVWDPNDQFMYFEFADLEGPIATDLDGDLNLEVVAGNTAYRHNGAIMWQRGDLPDGLTSPVYFPNVATPHVALSAAGRIWMLNGLTGATIWGPHNISARFGGAPTIFMDGTTGPWVGVAGDAKYTVFNAVTGAQRWQVTTTTNNGPGGTTVNAATAFDFGEGMRLIYPSRNELRIYRASDGVQVQAVPINVNVPVPGAPTIADIDDDGHADLVVNDAVVGVGALSNQTWNDAPSVWNQAAHHVVNVVNEMAKIPARETQTAYSKAHYRTNVPIPPPTTVARPNVVAGLMRADTSKYPQTVKLTVRVANNGWTPVNPVNVAFYSLSGSTSTFLGLSQSNVLKPGAYQDVIYSISNPTLGSFTYYAVADDKGTPNSGVIVECNETDNRADNLPVTITSDVAIEPATLAVSNTHPNPGEKLDFIAGARITGSVDTTTLKAQFYNGNPAAGGVSISTPVSVIVSTAADGKRTASATFSWNQNLADGNYTIYVVFDPANAIVENDETNNSGSYAITVTTQPTADVAADSALSLISDPQPRPTDTVELSGTARINGNVTAAQLFAQFRLDDPVSGRNLSGLVPVTVSTRNGITTATANTSWVVDAPEGIHSIFAVFDPANAILEVDETNNAGVMTAHVTTPQIIKKLAASLTLNPPGAEAGRPVEISVLAQNIGNVPLTNVVLNYSVTGPASFSGSKTIDALPKNDYITITAGSFIATTNGNYTVTVTAADPDVIFNSTPATIKIAPFATAAMTAVPSQVPVSLPLVQCHTKITRGNTIVVADDPMIPLVKTHIQRGLNWQAPILNAGSTEGCFKCHVQSQGIVAFENSRLVSGVTIDTTVEQKMWDQTVPNQLPQGWYQADWPRTSAMLGAWSLSYWHNIEQAKPSLLKALDALIPMQTAGGQWECEHCEISYGNREAMTMMGMISFARGFELTQDARYQTTLVKAVNYAMAYDYASARTRGPEFAARILIGLTAAQPQIQDPSLAAAVNGRIATIAAFLQSLQNPDGSFGQLTTPAKPIVRNAQVLYALAKAGVPGTDPGLRASIMWLINKQEANGGWREGTDNNQITWLDESTWAMIALPAAFLRLGQFDVEYEVFLPSTSDLVSSNIGASSSTAVTGGKLLKWRLAGVTDSGYDLFFNVRLNGLQNGESRPATGPASIAYQNPYTNEKVKRDVSVPSVTGYAPLTLAVSTDQPAYGPNTNVTITQTVGNVGTTNDGITTDLVIRDAAGTTVATIVANEAVQGLPPTSFPGWHYAIPVTFPIQNDGVRRLVVLDVDFAQKLAALGATGTFDRNSIRISGDNAPTTELYFNWVEDAPGASKGKLFITIPDEAAVGTNYALKVYFDIIQNGFKPASMFDRVAAGQGSTFGSSKGFTAKYYRLDTSRSPSQITQISQIFVHEPPQAVAMLTDSFPGGYLPPAVQRDFFVQIWEGVLFVPSSGVYQFNISSDDGSWLYIDDQLLINNGGLHAISTAYGSRQLSAGFHPFKVYMYEWGGGEYLGMQWAPPGQGWSTITSTNLMTALPAAPPELIVVGGAQALPNGNASRTYSWNTGVTAAAPYTAVGSLRQYGAFIASTAAPFTITPASALAGSLATDKAAYNPNETVQIAGSVQYSAGNTTLRNLTSTIAVLDPAGAVVATGAPASIATLNPGQSVPARFDWPTGSAPAGIYSAKLTVTDSAGAKLLEKSVPFEIKSTAQTGKGVSGTVTVAATVPQGTDATLAVSVKNDGNAALTDAPFLVQIIDPLTQNVVQQWTFTVPAFAAGAIESRQFSHNTFEEAEQQYIVFLSSQVVTPATQLSQAKYTVTPSVPVVSATVAGDKPFYDVNDPARITGNWTYVSGGRTLRNTKAVVTVADATGNVLATGEGTITSLVPGNAAAPIVVEANVGRIPPGTYTAKIVVTDPRSGELAVATAPIEVRSTVVSGKGITGTITAPATVNHKDPLPISFSITNLGNAGVTDAPFAVQLVRGGNVALTLPVSATVAKDATYSSGLSTDTKPLAPGVYDAVLVNLINGSVPLATTKVEIVPLPPVVTGVIATDKPLYDIHETVHVTSAATYVSGSYVIPVTGTLTITSPANAIMATTTVNVAAFNPDPPDNTFTSTLHWSTAVFAPGTYTATLAVKNAANETLATKATTFVVRSTAVSGKGISGTISTPPTVWEKNPLPVTNVITDSGNAALVNAPFAIWFTDPATSNVLDTVTFTASVDKGGSTTVQLPYDTIRLAIGHYTAVLVSMITGTPVTLASTPFEVERIPLRLEMSVGGPARVLIWNNCANGNSTKGCTPVVPEFITTTLTNAGIPWTLVGDQYTFVEKMRSGAYSESILYEPDSFEAKSAAEVMETIRGGFGMLYIKSSTNADPKLAPALGVSFGGKLNGTSTLVDLLATGFTAAGQVTFNGDSVKLTTTTAQVAGRISATQAPAVVWNTYGAGRVITIAYDVEKAPTADVAKLLLGGVNYISRIPTTDARQVVPIAFKVIPPANIPADLTITATLPAGMSVVFAQPTLTSTTAAPPGASSTVASWNVHTNGTEFTLWLWVRLPDTIGTYTVKGSGAFQGQSPVVTKTVTLTVAADRAAIETAIAADITALTAAAPAKDRKSLEDATAALNAAKTATSQTVALDQIMKLIAALEGVSVDTSPARKNADRLLLWWQS
jgi:uncharacterized repeat protein (TIGR01451 family)